MRWGLALRQGARRLTSKSHKSPSTHADAIRSEAWQPLSRLRYEV